MNDPKTKKPKRKINPLGIDTRQNYRAPALYNMGVPSVRLKPFRLESSSLMFKSRLGMNGSLIKGTGDRILVNYDLRERLLAKMQASTEYPVRPELVQSGLENASRHTYVWGLSYATNTLVNGYLIPCHPDLGECIVILSANPGRRSVIGKNPFPGCAGGAFLVKDLVADSSPEGLAKFWKGTHPATVDMVNIVREAQSRIYQDFDAKGNTARKNAIDILKSTLPSSADTYEEAHAKYLYHMASGRITGLNPLVSDPTSLNAALNIAAFGEEATWESSRVGREIRNYFRPHKESRHGYSGHDCDPDEAVPRVAVPVSKSSLVVKVAKDPGSHSEWIEVPCENTKAPRKPRELKPIRVIPRENDDVRQFAPMFVRTFQVLVELDNRLTSDVAPPVGSGQMNAFVDSLVESEYWTENDSGCFYHAVRNPYTVGSASSGTKAASDYIERDLLSIGREPSLASSEESVLNTVLETRNSEEVNYICLVLLNAHRNSIPQLSATTTQTEKNNE